MRRQAAGFAILVLLVASLSFAQSAPVNVGTSVPPVIRFSGTLAVPAGRVPVTFGLYADQAGGDPLWQETQTVPVTEAGRYAVLLGTVTGLSTELFASGEAKWLGVRAEGQAEQPRVLLVSVPYALKAADAETIGGKPLSAFVLAGDTTGTGADGLTYVNTQVLKAGLSSAGPLPQGAGTPGYLGVFTDSVNLGNSVIFQSGTSIGVGTMTPAAPFHVAGTSAPAAFFDVYSNALVALPTVYRAARGTPASPSAVQTDDILGGLAVRGYMTTGFSAGRGQVMFRAAENWTDSANGTYLQFTTTPTGTVNYSERMRISPAGDVGIGTTTPAHKLSVAGTIQSTTGGFVFPDGTTQATAARSVTGNNVAFGPDSLGSLTSGTSNTAFGSQALSANTEGTANTAYGLFALFRNAAGSRNTAIGVDALHYATGDDNIAVGWGAGWRLTNSSDNIAIGHEGVSAENRTIRIGTSGSQTRTFIAGIRGVTTGSANAVAVVIDSYGQLGTASSSRRVKDDIADMAGSSSALMNLRPVTFHYRSDQNPAGRTLQYGLIAEEVAEVYPGLVAHSADGQIETVMYQFLPPMLLNEVQKQQRTIDELRAQVAALTRAVAALSDRKQ